MSLCFNAGVHRTIFIVVVVIVEGDELDDARRFPPSGSAFRDCGILCPNSLPDDRSHPCGHLALFLFDHLGEQRIKRPVLFRGSRC